MIAVCLATLGLALVAAPVVASAGGAERSPAGPLPLSGLGRARLLRFETGLGRFTEILTPEKGLGPVFNDQSCTGCHNRPFVGGSSVRPPVTRFGRMGPDGFDPMTEFGGTLRQKFGITVGTCSVPGEVVPSEATLVTLRDTPPLFGLGLVDAIPDREILRNAARAAENGDGIRGRPNMVRGRVGRFGWKAQVATLHDFAGDAYLNEMGITSPDFPDEVKPQGGPVMCDTVPDPEDDGTGVAALTDFMTFLAPLRAERRSFATRAGRMAFQQVGCNLCHVSTLHTAAHTALPAGRRRVRLFSDLLLHDMGPELADGIEQGEASGSEFRTAPLWGVARSAPYLHDGRAATLEEAIVAHGGEAHDVLRRYLALPSADRAALIAYLGSL